ncbi:MAG TPA: type II toxin-antitoxin system VapC family toxin [Jiangellaceae bacterium]|jgi:predicted nucleic acid-binding protein
MPVSQHWTRSWTGPADALADPYPSGTQSRSSGQIVLVVDASILAVALADDGPDGDRARDRLRGEQLAAPEIVDLEVVSVLRGQLRKEMLDERRAALALRDLVDLPLQHASHLPLLPRCWELRTNLTPYDAAYVSLAEILDAALLTGDRRLASAPGPRCSIEVLLPSS